MIERLFPITFSIPEEKIVNVIPKKTKLLSSLIPGKLDTYIYQNEEDYYNEYKQSLFATTCKKGGWDCMRHYEIMANGCIPYFINIEDCPLKTMALLPKDLLIYGNFLYNKYKNTDINNFTKENMDECEALIEKLLTYLREHLTSHKLAQYILEKTNHSNVSRILCLSEHTVPDYLRCVTLHGFKHIFGAKCHEYFKVPHIYKTNDPNYKRLYGKGITYTNVVDLDKRDDTLDKTIVEDITNKKYDIVIYGAYHRGMPYYDLVKQVYKPNEIILLCGEDEHNCNYRDFLNNGHYVFVRELT